MNICNSLLVVDGEGAAQVASAFALADDTNLLLEESVPLIRKPDDAPGDAEKRTWATSVVEFGAIHNRSTLTHVGIYLNSYWLPPDRWLLYRALVSDRLLRFRLLYVEYDWAGRLEIALSDREGSPFGNPPESAPFFRRDELPPWSDDQLRRMSELSVLYGWRCEWVHVNDGPEEERFIYDLADRRDLSWDSDAWEALQHRREPEEWQALPYDKEARAAQIADVYKAIDRDRKTQA